MALIRVLALLGLSALLGAATPSAHPTFDAFGIHMTLEVSGADTHGKSSTLRLVSPPGGGPPAHVHTREDETYVIMRGRFRFWLGTHVMNLTPGNVVFLPRNVPHQWRNVGNVPGEMVMTIVPAGFEHFFATVSNSKLAMPKDAAKIVRLSTAYGITYVAPLDKAKPR